jgi:hypothetical protein
MPRLLHLMLKESWHFGEDKNILFLAEIEHWFPIGPMHNLILVSVEDYCPSVLEAFIRCIMLKCTEIEGDISALNTKFNFLYSMKGLGCDIHVTSQIEPSIVSSTCSWNVMSTTVWQHVYSIFISLSMVPPLFQSILSWVRELACISDVAKYAVAS